MHEVLVNRLGGLSLPRKSVVRLTDRSDITINVYVDEKQQLNYTAFLNKNVGFTLYGKNVR